MRRSARRRGRRRTTPPAIAAAGGFGDPPCAGSGRPCPGTCRGRVGCCGSCGRSSAAAPTVTAARANRAGALRDFLPAGSVSFATSSQSIRLATPNFYLWRNPTTLPSGSSTMAARPPPPPSLPSRWVRPPAAPARRALPAGVGAAAPGEGGRPSPAAFFDVLWVPPAGVDGLAQARRDVVDVAVADGTGHAVVVAVRVEADLLVPDPEADVVGLVGVRLHAQDGPVERLCSGQVPDRDDDGLDAVGHDCLLIGVDLEVTASPWPGWAHIGAEHGTRHGACHVAAALPATRPARENGAHVDADGHGGHLGSRGRDPDPG